MTSLAVGDLIRDNLGREGIVLASARRPSAKWLADQNDVRMRSASGRWWRVVPLDGGGVCVPEDLAVVVRRATVDDILSVMRNDSNDGGEAFLRHLFAGLRGKE